MLRPVALLPLLLLGACAPSSSAKDGFTQPPPSAFRAGPCGAAARAVLRVGADAHSLATGSVPDGTISDHLKADQAVIDALQPGLKPSFAQLVIAVGVVRLRIDTKTFVVPVANELSTAYDAVVRACTPTGAATSSP